MKEQKHIIVTDDDLAIQDATRMVLERRGYRVTTFSNGGPLIAGTFELPQLFILDKQLPGADGLDICRYLKGQKATENIPVLILSASPQVGRLAAACADGFLAKPFKMQELRDKVQQLIQ